MERVFPDKQLNYVLRMYLPHWNYDKILADIIRYCKETGTEHVLLFTDAQHMVWNQLTIEEARKEAGNIKRAVEDLKKHGIGVAINSSYNMIMSRFEHTKHNPQYKHWMTLADGTCEKRSPCLLDPALEDYIREFYGILASTGAEYIYIDDDHRYICDGRNNTWGCMCELHLQEFSRVSGTEWSREKLQHAIFNDPDVRRQWIRFLWDGLEHLAKLIEKAVHTVNPDMPIGLMVPSIHSTTLYAYDLQKMARTFQPDGTLIMRPCIGAYSDRDRCWVIAGLFYMEQIGHIMGDGLQYTLEIETTPFTRFSSSMKNIRLHIAQGIVNGMYNPLISACGYVGNSPFFEPEIAKMLKRERPFFETLIKIGPKYGTRKGIRMKYHRNSAYDTPETYPEVSDYFHPSFAVQDALTNSGFCTTYDESPVTMLAGDSVYSFTEKEILEMLSGNLILDAAAARGLAKLGFLEDIGAGICEMDTHFGAEYYEDEEWCGKYTGLYQPLQDVPLDDVKKITDLQPGAKVLTWVTDHNREKVAPAMVLFENKLGGKIAVMTYRIGPGTIELPHLICYQKQTLLRNILNWMDPRALPVYVEDPSCFYVQYFDDGSTVFTGLCNISYDVAEEAVLVFSDPDLDVERGVYLKEDGTLQPLTDIIEKVDAQKWKIRKQFTIFHYTALQIPKKG